jgi:hypothetical protein
MKPNTSTEQSFVKHLEFAGSLSQQDRSADDLHCTIEYSLLKQTDITGTITSSPGVAKPLSPIFEFTGAHLRLKGHIPHLETEFSSDHVIPLELRTQSEHGPNKSYQVVQVRLHDLTIKETLHTTEDTGKRHLTFFLAGPRAMWAISGINEKSFTGEEKFETWGSKIQLAESLPFDLEVSPWFFYDKTSPPDSFQLKANALTLRFKTMSSPEDLSDEQFLETGTAVAEDLILLVSFLSRRWLSWYRYELQSARLLQTYVRHTRECSDQPIEHDNSVVSERQARDFLSTAFTNLRKLRQLGINLRMPLIYSISGAEAKYVEEQFSILFLALERIKESFAIQNSLQSILSGPAFAKLRKSISDTVELATNDPIASGKMLLKIPELNRPALRTVLDALFAQYNIQWRDLYPESSDFTLIKTRDQLFHSSSDVEMDALIKELHRLQALVERTILAMLGWSDFRNAPPLHERKWLTTK